MEPQDILVDMKIFYHLIVHTAIIQVAKNDFY